MSRSLHTQMIKDEAIRLGFISVGVSKSGFLEKEAPLLEKWLKKGMQGEMKYMENHFDKRLDTTKLVAGSKSVVSLLFNYYNPQKQLDPEAPKLSMYAYGKDYHYVVKEKLNALMEFISRQIGEVDGRCFVDSAPVLDKAWAKKSGLGWLGKNGNLITPKVGSFYFIAELIIDLELDTDGPIKDYCGTCTRCIDACPTEAIVAPYVVDGSKCISYFTIELKESIPESQKGKFDNWMFGCDVCQQVCPWNRFSIQHNENQFAPVLELLSLTKKNWEELSRDKFNELFRYSAVKRTKYEGLMRNIRFLGND